MAAAARQMRLSQSAPMKSPRTSSMWAISRALKNSLGSPFTMVSTCRLSLIHIYGLTVIADAPVIAEHLDSIGVRAVELAPYGLGDLTHFKKITEAQGITWGEQDESGWEEYGLIAGHSADGAYEFSFVSGEKEQSTPLFWMSSLMTTYGSSADFAGGDISGMNFTEEERTALEEHFKERSEEILHQLCGGEFVLRDMRWRALRHLSLIHI